MRVEIGEIHREVGDRFAIVESEERESVCFEGKDFVVGVVKL